MLAFDRFLEWSDMMESVECPSEVNTPEDKYRVDATAQGIPKKPGDDYCRYEITESLENEKIKFRAWEKTKYIGTLSMFTSFSLEPVGTDTKVTYETESEKFLGIFGKFLEKLYLRRWAEKQMQNALENLKNILEQ